MLFQETIEKIKTNFPKLIFSTDEKDKSITIPSNSKEVGDVVIVDDSFEMTVYIGNFTHWHASCNDESLSAVEKEAYIVSEVVEFMTNLFNEKIVMWGSNETGGGFYNIEINLDEQDAPLEPESEIIYNWFGKVVS